MKTGFAERRPGRFVKRFTKAHGLLPSKMGRHQPKMLARIPELPTVPSGLVEARPCRPVAPGAVRRVAWLRAGQNGAGLRGLLCAAAMVLSSFGCEATTPPEVEDTALVTDGTSFPFEKKNSLGHVWYRAEIPYSFTNRTGSNVYLLNCRGGFAVRLQVEEAGHWAHYWSPVILACLSPPIVIEPDEVYETTVNVVGCTSGGNCAPRLTLPSSASTRYRIMWGDGRSSYDHDGPPWGDLIPLEERVSNSFTLRVAN